eukprot:4881237-Alexandrium_andersonii.AAC.1
MLVHKLLAEYQLLTAARALSPKHFKPYWHPSNLTLRQSAPGMACAPPDVTANETQALACT